MVSGDLGWIDTPDQCNQGGRPAGVVWIADNGCFGKKVFDQDRWFTWLQNHPDIENCMFATAPDVVGDHAATLIQSAPWLPKIRALGYPAAFVAQDGATPDTMPWASFDALFIGGTDDFKMSQTAQDIAAAAKRRGMWVHVGRVNSRQRYLRFSAIADSADGTFILFGPRIRLPELLGWVQEYRNRIPLWEDA
jgi:hypothetical protein